MLTIIDLDFDEMNRITIKNLELYLKSMKQQVDGELLFEDDLLFFKEVLIPSIENIIDYLEEF
ncbi:hypothetical protein [Caudoviricetes sp.]|nr:hypothetical protein [Caudoviricetes sp.]